MTEDKKVNIDYRDPDSLKGFISENGKILSSRYTRLNAKEQRKLTKTRKQKAWKNSGKIQKNS